jgi:hypothetical protein
MQFTGNNHCLLREQCKVHKNTLWTQCRILADFFVLKTEISMVCVCVCVCVCVYVCVCVCVCVCVHLNSRIT